jgi:hypothetical protein
MRRTLERRHFLGRATVGRRIAALTLLAGLVASACGSEPPALEPIPATALPGSAAEPVPLDAATLAVDAIEFGELETLLNDAGFVAGTQRLFSRNQGGRRRVLARVLTFETAGGAERYLEWIRTHAEELIGDAVPNTDLDIAAGGTVFEHEPDPCCHNETRIFLAVWSRGSRVFTLEVGGQAARASDVPELIAELDAAV